VVIGDLHDQEFKTQEINMVRSNKPVSMFQSNDIGLRKRHKLDANYWVACSAVVTACVWAYRYPFRTIQMLMSDDVNQYQYPQSVKAWIPHIAELVFLFTPLLVTLFLFHISRTIDIVGDQYVADKRATPATIGASTVFVDTGSSSVHVNDRDKASISGARRLDSVGNVIGRVQGAAVDPGYDGVSQGVGSGLRKMVQEWVPSKYLSLYNPPIINIDTPVGAAPVVDIIGSRVGTGAAGSNFSSNNPINYDASVANMLLRSPSGGHVDTADGVTPSSGTEVMIFNSMKLTDANKTQFVSRYQKQQGDFEEETALVTRSSSHHLHQHTRAGAGGATSRIAYKNAPVTIGSGEDLYYQLPSSASILATGSGSLTSGDGLMHMERPTSVHGYRNKPLHVTTALFGAISSSVTSTNAVNLMNSLNDNTLEAQQLLALGECFACHIYCCSMLC